MGRRTRRSFQLLAGLALLATLSACGLVNNQFPLREVTATGIDKLASGSPAFDPSLTFCSPLSFDGIVWNPSLTLTERRSLALALSISGAFEGDAGWSNITNSFDGMGLSAGLLNQTLGTDSLQPLLAEMQYANEADFNSSFSSNHRSSIQQMLETWKVGKSWKPKSLSILLAEAGNRDQMQIHALATPSSLSVAWAEANLYQSDGSFIPSWKSEIQSLLVKPAYVSLQVEAARRYHNRAIEYLTRIGMFDLRAYLVMFDIVTQNGSISDSTFDQWEAQVRQQKLTSNIDRLRLLVDLRVLDANPEYQEDVRTRKYTLMNGTGKVHGRTLNLPQSYCYSPNDPIR